MFTKCAKGLLVGRARFEENVRGICIVPFDGVVVQVYVDNLIYRLDSLKTNNVGSVVV